MRGSRTGVVLAVHKPLVGLTPAPPLAPKRVGATTAVWGSTADPASKKLATVSHGASDPGTHRKQKTKEGSGKVPGSFNQS